MQAHAKVEVKQSALCDQRHHSAGRHTVRYLVRFQVWLDLPLDFAQKKNIDCGEFLDTIDVLYLPMYQQHRALPPISDSRFYPPISSPLPILPSPDSNRSPITGTTGPGNHSKVKPGGGNT